MPVFNKNEFLTTKAEMDALLGRKTPFYDKSQTGDLSGEMRTFDSLSDTNAPKILLIGDTGGVFSGADVLSKLSCEIHTNMLDGINAAAKGRFAAIAVVMSGLSGRLTSALKALRKVGAGGKIILLAQMYEEPGAIRLIESGSNGSVIADDYLICPIQTDNFYKAISPGNGRAKAAPAASIAPVSRINAAVANANNEKITQLEKLATEDELTGLKNRRYIWEFARQTIDNARKQNGQVTLLVFDIDNFKHYNDVYGHSAGDEVLKQAAVLMQRCCRSHDIVGRIGGDEFAVIFWDHRRQKPPGSEAERRSALADHPKEAIFIAKRFRKEVEKTELHLLGPDGKGVLAISGGLASFPRDGSTIQEVFQQADTALLEAKRRGKNRIYLVGRHQGDIDNIN